MTLPEIHRRGAAALMGGLAALGLLAGLLLNLVGGSSYAATSTVLVQWRPADVVTLLLTGQAESVSAEDVSDVAGTLTSRAVLDRVADEVPGDRSATDLRTALTATPVPSSHLVTIQATDDTRAGAVRIAEAAATALATQQRAEVRRAVQDLPASAAASDLQVRADVVGARVQPVQVLGEATTEQTSPTLRTPLALAVAGLALGGLVVIGLSLRRRKVEPDGRPRLVPVVRAPSPSRDDLLVPATVGLLPGWPEVGVTVGSADAASQPAAEELLARLRREVGGEATLRSGDVAEASADGRPGRLVLVVDGPGALDDGVAALAEDRDPDLVVVVRRRAPRSES